MDKVAKMLNELEEDHKHVEIFKSMVFSDTVKMREKRENAVVKCHYSCEKEVCDLSACLVDIHKHPKLLKYLSKDVCLAIIQDIENHQDDFLPSQVDGFFINRMGHDLVHLKRSDCDNNGVTGFIEYNDLRKHSMDYYDQQKLRDINYVIEEASKKKDYSSCSIM